MSRHGYTDDADESRALLYAANVERALRGKRGQAFLRELVAVLDAMPEKELATGTAVSGDRIEPGECRACALGAVTLARGIDVSPITYANQDDEDEDGTLPTEWMADALGIGEMLAREIAYQNDDAYCARWSPGRGFSEETPAERWQRVRSWAASKIVDGGAK